DVLVDDPPEADPRVVPEQPHLPVRGEAGTGVEENIMGHMPRVRELGPEPGDRSGADALVRIDVEDPLAAGEIEPVIAGGGEIVPPREVVQARAARGRDLPGAVGGAGVHDHDLVHQPFQGEEAAVEELLLVLDDEARRQEHAARRGCLRPRRGPRDRKAGKLSTLTPTEIACTANSHVGESPLRRRGALPLFFRARSLHQQGALLQFPATSSPIKPMRISAARSRSWLRSLSAPQSSMTRSLNFVSSLAALRNWSRAPSL